MVSELKSILPSASDEMLWTRIDLVNLLCVFWIDDVVLFGSDKKARSVYVWHLCFERI